MKTERPEIHTEEDMLGICCEMLRQTYGNQWLQGTKTPEYPEFDCTNHVKLKVSPEEYVRISRFPGVVGTSSPFSWRCGDYRIIPVIQDFQSKPEHAGRVQAPMEKR